MNISGPAAVAKPEMLFYAPGDLTVTLLRTMDYCVQGRGDKEGHDGQVFAYPVLD